MPLEPLRVLENGQPITFTLPDLTRYHGHGFPGGVAHAYRVMEAAFARLNGGAPMERREIAVRTAFKGPGGRDAFEMVTRAVTDGRFEVTDELAKPERGTTLANYVFALSYRGETVCLQIRPGYVTDEFIALGRKPDRTGDEDARLEILKREMAERLLAPPADEVYEITA